MNNTGRVLQVIGPVIDVEFLPEHLPAIYNAVSIETEADGVKRTIIAEVMQHLGDSTVRCVAMSSTDGLMRGMQALDTGSPIKVPVGQGTLGRIFNVLGETVDNDAKEVVADDRWPIHRPAPKLEDQTTSTESLETGIKVVDLIAP